MAISSLILFVSLLPASLSSSTPSPSSSLRRFSKIYAFGDSYTDTGNTHSGTGPRSFTSVSQFPYGTTFFHHPTNRYSDGRLVVDFLATKLSLPFLPPYLNHNSNFANGANFAVAGATALDHKFFVKNNLPLDITPQSLSTQLRWFSKYLAGRGCFKKGSPACDEAFKDALFWVGEIGANDYAYSIGSPLRPKVIRELTVEKTIGFLQALLERGAKYMIVQGLPPTGCLPLAMILAPSNDRDDIGCSASENNNSNNHNMLLQVKLQELRRRYPAALISYADFYNAHRTIMKNPKARGFVEPFKVCCGSGGGPYNFDPFSTCGSPAVSKACPNPNEFVNWDGVHLTEAMYRNIAHMFFHGNYCKPSFAVLLNARKNRE